MTRKVTSPEGFDSTDHNAVISRVRKPGGMASVNRKIEWARSLPEPPYQSNERDSRDNSSVPQRRGI